MNCPSSLEYFHEEFPSDSEIREEISAIDMFGETDQKEAESGRKILAQASRIAMLQARRMDQEELSSVYRRIELPLIEVLADMEKTGIRADGEELEEIGDGLKEQIGKITSAIYASAGEEFNINSPKQLGTILFDKLKLPPGKKTKSGYSTNAETLEHLARDYEIAAQVLEFRMLTKLNGTYVEGMLPLIDSQSRIHAHFQQTVTTTGRLQLHGAESSEYTGTSGAGKTSEKNIYRFRRRKNSGGSRLFPDRTAHHGASLSGSCSHRSFRKKSGHSPEHGVTGVRCPS